MIDSSVVINKMRERMDKDTQYLAANVFLKPDVGMENYYNVALDPASLDSSHYLVFTVESELGNNTECLHMINHDDIERIEIFIWEL